MQAGARATSASGISAMHAREVAVLGRFGAALIEAVGTPDFARTLSREVGMFLPVAQISAFYYDGAQPITLFLERHDRPELGQALSTAYVESYYQRDPLLAKAGERRAGAGEPVFRSIESIEDEDYAKDLFLRGNLSAKLAQIAPFRTGVSYVNLYFRRPGEVGAANLSADFMRAMFDMLQKGLARHLDLTGLGAVSADNYEALLRTLAPALSERECRVCAHTLRGITAEGIGHELAISPETVRTYRKRAYRKLGVTSVAELYQRALAGAVPDRTQAAQSASNSAAPNV